MQQTDRKSCENNKIFRRSFEEISRKKNLEQNKFFEIERNGRTKIENNFIPDIFCNNYLKHYDNS